MGRIKTRDKVGKGGVKGKIKEVKSKEGKKKMGGEGVKEEEVKLNYIRR